MLLLSLLLLNIVTICTGAPVQALGHTERQIGPSEEDINQLLKSVLVSENLSSNFSDSNLFALEQLMIAWSQNLDAISVVLKSMRDLLRTMAQDAARR